ncbi:hypothetical protein Hanom_Chr02g00110651 [Helianthus anomalus]
MVMHMVVVTLSLGFFKKNVFFFFTFHPKVFHKLLLTKNYLFFFTFNKKLFIFCNLSSQFFLLSTLVLYSFHFPQIFRFMLRSKFCDLTHRNVRLWFNVFTFCSEFCELTRCNVCCG